MKTTRRTFLGGVAAAALPVAAVASEGITTAQTEPSALGALIAAYNEVTAEADQNGDEGDCCRSEDEWRPFSGDLQFDGSGNEIARRMVHKRHRRQA